MAQPSDKNATLLNATETVLLVSSIGSSVASVVLQQVTLAAFTSVQLSLVLGLNSLNRRRLDDLNQRNESAIAQIQQQFLKEQSSVRQIEEETQKLPTHQDIATLQQQIEQVKDSFQKQLNPLSEAVEAKSNLLNRLNEELASFKESVNPVPLAEIEILKTRVDNCTSQLETTLKQLEAQFEQSLLQAESRLSEKNEPFLRQLSMLRTQYEQLKGIASEQKQIPQKTLQELSDQIAELTFLKEFNPEDLQNNFQNLSEKVEKLGESIKQLLASDTQPEKFIELEKLSQSHQDLKNRIKNTEIEATKAVNMFRYLDTRLKKLEKEPTNSITCDWCGEPCNSPIKGGLVLNQNFCSNNCKYLREKKDEEDSSY